MGKCAPEPAQGERVRGERANAARWRAARRQRAREPSEDASTVSTFSWQHRSTIALAVARAGFVFDQAMTWAGEHADELDVGCSENVVALVFQAVRDDCDGSSNLDHCQARMHRRFWSVAMILDSGHIWPFQRQRIWMPMEPKEKLGSMWSMMDARTFKGDKTGWRECWHRMSAHFQRFEWSSMNGLPCLK